ncbi:MAG: hypothetical protein ACF8GE_00855 [Phycisphaerales bacterium JB043]
MPRTRILAASLALALPTIVPCGLVTSSLAQEEAQWDESVYEHAVVDRIVRTAVIQYRDTPNRSDIDHRMMALVFEFAARHRDDDVYLWRRAAEAWRTAQDTRRELGALRRVLRLDPRDTLAQLRLLNHAIENLDTAEERLARYDKMLSTAGSGLDPSIRSRLALDASLLHRELGNRQRFLQLLTLATQLDSTNLDAATLTARVGLEKTADPLARVELLANVVLADPLRFESHLALADEFLRHGAFMSAARFYDTTRALASSHDVTLDEHVMLRTLLAEWGAHGAPQVLQKLRDDEARFLYTIERQRAGVEEGLIDPSEVMVFKPIESSETLQFYLGLALEDDEAVTTSLDRLVQLNDERVQGYRALRDTEQASENEIALGIFSARAEIIWLSLLANKRIDEAARWRDELVIPDLEQARRTVSRLNALLSHRTGDSGGAEQLLDGIINQDPLAHLALAIIERDHERPVNAARAFARATQHLEGQPPALWARSMIEKLLEQSLNPTSVSATLESYARSLPTTIDEFASEPSRWQDLRVEAVPSRVSPTDRIELRVTITNTSPFPLAVGEGRPIETRLLCAPRLTLSGQLAHQLARPEIVQMGTRLRLMPGESVTQTAWLGAGQLGEVVMRLLYLPASVRWRVVQGFAQDASGRYITGPHSVSNSSASFTRPVVRFANDPSGTLIEAFSSSTPGELLDAVLVSGNSFLRADDASEPNEQFRIRNELSETITQRAQALPDALRALLVLQMPTSSNFQAELGQLDNSMSLSTDPLVQLAYMLTRVTRADDPFLAYARQSATNPIVLEMIDAYEASLRESDRID